MEANLRFKIDWASLIVGRKFTIFALFYLCVWGKFPSTSPPGAYIWRGDLTEGFFALRVWGAYIWRGQEPIKFYGLLQPRPQGFSLKKWPLPFFKGKALGTRLGLLEGLIHGEAYFRNFAVGYLYNGLQNLTSIAIISTKCVSAGAFSVNNDMPNRRKSLYRRWKWHMQSTFDMINRELGDADLSSLYDLCCFEPLPSGRGQPTYENSL